MNDRRPAQGNVAMEPRDACVSQRALDRLVDGELAPDERRGLLVALAGEPGGWQRCAAAFLEAQSWRKACRQLATEGESARGAAPLAQQLWRRPQVHRLAAGLAATAAVLVLVFWGGLAAGRAWPTTSPMARENPSESTTPSSAKRTPVAQETGPGGDRREGRLVVHVLGFINVQGEDGERHAVPILAAPGLKVDPPQPQASTLAARDPARDASDVPRFEIAGGANDRATFPLASGRRVAIPVNLVTIAQGQPIY